MNLKEYDLLGQFWAAANSGQISRLELLREYASIVVGERPTADARVRAMSKQARKQAKAPSYECFACRWTYRQIRLVWHHVIQVQHGGSWSIWNQVPLCGDCHALVHPWLPRPGCKGWISIGQVAKAAEIRIVQPPRLEAHDVF